MLVSNSAGYKVFCETKHIDVLPGHYHVRVYSTYEHSKDPEYQQSKFDMVLSATELEQFRQALTA
jgi:hypothetical protein